MSWSVVLLETPNLLGEGVIAGREDFYRLYPNEYNRVFITNGPEPKTVIVDEHTIEYLRNQLRVNVRVLRPFVRHEETPVPAPKEKRELPKDLGAANKHHPADYDPLNAAKSAQTREELARNLSALRSRINNISSVDIPEGDVSVSEDGTIKVGKKKRSRYKEEVENLKATIASAKFKKGVAEQIADCLLNYTGNMTTQVVNDIAKLRVKELALLTDLLQSSCSFQLEKFLNSSEKDMKAKFRKEGAERKKFLRSLARLSDQKPIELEEKFTRDSETFLSGLFKSSVARERLQNCINEVVAVSTALEMKTLLLSQVGTKWKEEILSKTEGHLERIAEADFVKKITFTGQTVVVLVGPVVVKHLNLKYFLGDIEIRINLDRHNEGPTVWPPKFVSFFNTTIGKVSEFHTPHIMGRGENICWGTAKESAFALFSNWNWTVLVGFLWKYLCSYNPSSKYSPLETVSRVAVQEATKRGEKIPEGCTLFPLSAPALERNRL